MRSNSISSNSAVAGDFTSALLDMPMRESVIGSRTKWNRFGVSRIVSLEECVDEVELCGIDAVSNTVRRAATWTSTRFDAPR